MTNSSNKRVCISEHHNELVVYDSALTDSEHLTLWYTQQEYQEMKDSRHAVLRAFRKLVSPSPSSCYPSSCSCPSCPSASDNLCIRGLEQLLPNGKSRVQQKKETIKAIVTMYHQLTADEASTSTTSNSTTTTTTTAAASASADFLKSFCITKTRYAQHAANLIAVQDAAAAVLAAIDDTGGRHLDRVCCALSSSLSSTEPSCCNSSSNNKITLSSSLNNRSSRQNVLQRGRLPIRAPTA